MIIIRKAKINDFDAIFALRKTLWETELPFDPNLKADYFETEDAKNEVLKAIKARKKLFLVAENEHNIIGMADGYLINDCQYYHEKVAYLAHICVDKNYRQQGIGKLLIDTFGKEMNKQGAKFIKLCAFRENLQAVSLYEKEGFQEYSVYYTKKL